MGTFGLLSLIIFTPLLGVILLAFIPSNKVGSIKLLSVIVTIIPLILAIGLYAGFDSNAEGMQYVENVDWIEVPLGENLGFDKTVLEIDYSLGVDGLSMPLIILAAIVASMSAIASVNMIKKRWKEYFIIFFLMQVGLYGVFAAQNLFLFFIFFEISVITMFFLIGIWGQEKRENAAFTFLLYNGLGSIVMFVVFIALIMNAGLSMGDSGSFVLTSDISTIIHNLTADDSPYRIIGNESLLVFNETFLYAMFFGLLFAFGIKIPLFPLHSWILKAHYQAPAPMSMILSGILLKIGVYGLFRMEYGFFPEISNSFATLFIILGIINLFYGGILAFVQKSFKMVVVYSSISHMGIILLGLGAMNSFGFEGAVFQMVSHGLLSALLFYMVGIIYGRVNTTDFEKLGGMAKVMPYTSGILLAAALASLGLPGMSGFISEFMAFVGVFENHAILGAISVVGIVITTLYLLRATLNITYGSTSETLKDVVEARSIEVIPMIVLLGVVILVGVYPSILSEPLQTTIQSLLTGIGG